MPKPDKQDKIQKSAIPQQISILVDLFERIYRNSLEYFDSMEPIIKREYEGKAYLEDMRSYLGEFSKYANQIKKQIGLDLDDPDNIFNYDFMPLQRRLPSTYTIRNITDKKEYVDIYESDDITAYLTHLLDMFTTFDKMIAIAKKMLAVMDIEYYMYSVMGQRSKTFTDKIIISIKVVRRFTREYYIVKQDVFAHIYEEVLQKINQDNVNTVINVIINYPVTNDLIVYLLQYLVGSSAYNNKYKLSESQVNKLLDRVEVLKKESLGITKNGPNLQAAIDKNVDFISYSLLKYNLIPVTEFNEVSKIFEIISDNTNYKFKYSNKKSPIDNILQNASDNSIGVIIAIYPDYMTPIEFNMSSLINPKYIAEHNLSIPETTGINSKVIKKFDIINLIDNANENNSIKKNTKQIYAENTDSDNIIIFSIMKDKYRLLCTEINKYVCDRGDIRSLIDGKSYKIKKYNEIINNKIINEIAEEKYQNVIREYEGMKVSKTETGITKLNMQNALVKAFTKLYDEEKPTNSKEIIYLIMEKMPLKDLFIETLEHTIGISGLGSTEYALTYVHKINNILNRFTGEMKRKIKRMKIPKKIFEEYKPEDLRKYVIESYQSLVKDIIKILDAPPSVWEDYDFSLKDHIMEKKFIIA